MAQQDPRIALTPRQKWPWVALALTLLLVLIYRMEEQAMRWGMDDEFLNDFTVSWQAFLTAPWKEFPKIIASTFLHGSREHLIHNLVFFLIFAPFVERTLGSLSFIFCFLCSGLVADLTQGFFTPFSGGGLGASGAISGIAGVYFVLSPLRSIALWRKILALFLAGFWFVSQVQHGFLSLKPTVTLFQVPEIAYWAHVGGFIVGALWTLPLLFPVAKPTLPE